MNSKLRKVTRALLFYRGITVGIAPHPTTIPRVMTPSSRREHVLGMLLWIQIRSRLECVVKTEEDEPNKVMEMEWMS